MYVSLMTESPLLSRGWPASPVTRIREMEIEDFAASLCIHQDCQIGACRRRIPKYFVNLWNKPLEARSHSTASAQPIEESEYSET